MSYIEDYWLARIAEVTERARIETGPKRREVYRRLIEAYTSLAEWRGHGNGNEVRQLLRKQDTEQVSERLTA